MATLKITTKLRHETEGWERGKAGTEVTTTGAHVQVFRNTIGTSEEEIAISADITGGSDPGYLWLYNAGPTNYVQVGVATGAYFARLAAGQHALVPLDSGVTSLFLKANTAGVDVEGWIVEQ